MDINNPLDQRHKASVLIETVQLILRLVPEFTLMPHDDRRAAPRLSVNLAAMLTYDDQVWMPIYIRDICETGVGFRHGVRLHAGKATISFKIDDLPPVQLRTRLLWCEQTEEGFYISGGNFLAVADDVASPW